MPERKPKRAPRAATTQVEGPGSAGLDPLEDRVIRSRQGLTVPDEAALPQKDDGLPEALRARLRAIEVAAFEKAGRLAELEAELEQEEEAERVRETSRAKILDRLRAPVPDKD